MKLTANSATSLHLAARRAKRQHSARIGVDFTGTNLHAGQTFHLDARIQNDESSWTLSIGHQPGLHITALHLQPLREVFKIPSTALWCCFPLLHVITWEDDK